MTKIHEILTVFAKKLLREYVKEKPVILSLGGKAILSDNVEVFIKTIVKQINQQQKEQVEKLEHVYLVAWSIVHANHSAAAVQGDEIDSCSNPDCQSIQAAFAELGR